MLTTQWSVQSSELPEVDVLPALLLMMATLLLGGLLLSFVHTNAARQRCLAFECSQT